MLNGHWSQAVACSLEFLGVAGMEKGARQPGKWVLSRRRGSGRPRAGCSEGKTFPSKIWVAARNCFGNFWVVRDARPERREDFPPQKYGLLPEIELKDGYLIGAQYGPLVYNCTGGGILFLSNFSRFSLTNGKMGHKIVDGRFLWEE